MKKIYAILAVAAVAACTAFAVSSFASRDPFFEANVEALTNDEAYKVKTCYISYSGEGAYEDGFFCAQGTNIGTFYSCRDAQRVPGFKSAILFCIDD